MASSASTVEGTLHERIRRNGPMSFAEFMEEALYGEGGYYARDDLAIGAEGDFITGSSISGLFGRSTARLLSRLADRLGSADYLEVGYGSGAHLRAMGETLADSHAGRLLAWDRIARPLPKRFSTPEALERAEIRGLVFSYELFDALPVRRLVRRGDGWRELFVSSRAGAFEWTEEEAPPPPWSPSQEADFAVAEEGQIVDWTDTWGSLYGRLASALAGGLLVTCDYGFERERLLDARVRRHGTLACYRKQRVHRDPFVDVGRQDLTAHVDWSELIQRGEAAGLETVALVSQAEFLAGCGLFDELAEGDLATRVEAAHLLNPDGMGTEIRVLIQARNCDVQGLFDVDLD